MTPSLTPPTRQIDYPDSDGQPMSDNTLQFKWIVTIEGGIDSVFDDDPNVFVAGDLLWYPVEGNNLIRCAPDTLVAFGRPKGERGSYRQWEEAGIAPQVVFEVLSPGNRAGEMTRKFELYERYGVEECYIYDPDDPELTGYLRRGGRLEKIAEPHGWVSPRLGIRFDISGPEMVIYRPDGERFLTYRELRRKVGEKHRLAEEERLARIQAQQRADDAKKQVEKFAEHLRKLGIDPDQLP